MRMTNGIAFVSRKWSFLAFVQSSLLLVLMTGCTFFPQSINGKPSALPATVPPTTTKTTSSPTLPSPTSTVSSSPTSPSTPGVPQYPIQVPLNISASCHAMQVDITSVELDNSQLVSLNMTFTNNSSTSYQESQLSPLISLANSEKHRFATAGSFPFPPLPAHTPVNLRYDFVPLDTTSGTSYVLSWKLVNNGPGATWTCIFPQENITLKY